MVLTERDEAILDFEPLWWADVASKATAVTERPAHSTARHHDISGGTLVDPEASQLDLLVVRRLRLQRDRRRPEYFEARPANDWPSR